MNSQTQRNKQWLPKLWLTVVLVLGSCDGGIFGTGDGDITTLPNEAIDSGNNLDTMDGAPVTSSGEDLDSTDGTSNGAGFENLFITGNSVISALTVINVSDHTLSISIDSNNQPIITALAKGSYSPAVSLPDGTLALNVYLPAAAGNMLTLEPLNIAASTVTTLLVRNSLSAAAATGMDSNVVAQDLTDMLELIPLRTLTEAAAGTAQIRIILANALDADDTVGSLSLRPAGEQPGGAELAFNNLSAASASLSAYQVAVPGDYELVDSLNRIPAIALHIDSGEVYTIVVTNQGEQALLIHQDSAID